MRISRTSLWICLVSLGCLAVACSQSRVTVRGPVASAVGPEASFAHMGSARVVQAAMHYPKVAAEVAAAPLSLTASDGTGLRLTTLRARAVVEGPLAFTELHLIFNNPQNRVREGRFAIALPAGAAVSRFAMKLASGTWQEAEVVERQKARQVYEDFLHRRQDPALLEKQAGNKFTARVFPIPAGADKEIIISFSQQLSGADAPYRLHLKGLPRIDTVDISAMVARQIVGSKSETYSTVEQRIVQLKRDNHAPDKDFVVATDASLRGLGHGNLAAVRIKPAVDATAAPLKSLLVLVDTSASRAAGYQAQVAKLGDMLRQLEGLYDDDMPLYVACFDQQVSGVFQGRLGAFGQQHLDQILTRRALGASNLAAALSWAKELSGYKRLLLLTDGVATAGKTETAELRRAVAQLKEGVDGFERVDAVLLGGIRDEQAMRSLVTGVLSQDGVVLDGDQSAPNLALRLSRRTVSGIKVEVPGARWIWPQQLDGVQPGDEVLLFADLQDSRVTPQGEHRLRVALSGPISQQETIQLAAVKRPLLERAWVGARIASLQQRSASGDIDPDMQGAIRQQIIGLSRKHRVLSDYTALLVLETEADYARYGIERAALANILVVGPSGIEIAGRDHKQIARVVRRPAPVKPPVARPEPQGGDPAPGPVEAVPTESVSADEEAREGGPRAPRQMPAPASSPPTAPAAKAGERRPMKRAKLRTARRRRARPQRPEALEQQQAARDSDALSSAPAGEASRSADRRRVQRIAAAKERQGPPALTGKLAEVASLIENGQVEQALLLALRWRSEAPGDVLALIALGQALEAAGQPALAARAYGSIIDLFAGRADLRRYAAQRLEVLGKHGLPLALDSLEKAAKQRPDHATGHRLLAMAQLRTGQPERAIATLEQALKQSYRISRRGVQRILREDLGLAAAALLAREPKRRAEIEKRLSEVNGHIADRASLRFVLSWETDANDVDFHIRDHQGGHAYYSSKSLPSGGQLYADVTNGYGPECFAIDGEPTAYPYRLSIHYYSRGPMGYGMGTLQVIEHDGQGHLRFEGRPFVVMNDHAYVDLGPVKGPHEKIPAIAKPAAE